MLLRRARLGAVGLLTLGLGSCVISDKPLIVGNKPIFGDRFDAVLFRDFTEGAGYSAQKVGYHWSDGYYLRASAGGKHVVRFAAEMLSATDFLIERSQDDRAAGQAKLFTYFIARKVADGAYLVAPLNENDLSAADREAMCDKDQPEGFCSIKDHDQLMTPRGPPRQDPEERLGRRPDVRGRAEGRECSRRRSAEIVSGAAVERTIVNKSARQGW